MVGTTIPFVIDLNKVDSWSEDENGPSKPLVIALPDNELGDALKDQDDEIKPVVIKIPLVEEYNPKAAHWDYGTGEIDVVMRSERCYAPRKGEPEKRAATKENVEQLQSIIRTSEYEIIEQLRKMSAQISLLDLFINSEKHKNALMKVLNEKHVPETINEVQLEDFVGAILLKNEISFSDEDFPVEGRAHNKALYISVRCHGKEVSRVLINNGSAFNLCPLTTLKSLGISEDLIKTSKATIRSFDGMAKHVVGEIELNIIIGPANFSIVFQVLDIPSAFALLLWTPWIHVAGAVPSSLHHKVRFVINNRMITVHGESEHRSYLKGLVPYVEPQKKEELSYHSFELASIMHIPAGTKITAPEFSRSSIMAGRILLLHGFVPGTGLGNRTELK